MLQTALCAHLSTWPTGNCCPNRGCAGASDCQAWQRQRLQAMQMAAQGKWALQQIADAVVAGRSMVAGWLKLLRAEGFEALLQWKEGQGAPSKLTAEIEAGLRAGRWRRARDLLSWLQQEHGIEMGLGGAYYYLGKAGGVLKVPRKTHAKKRRGKSGSL